MDKTEIIKNLQKGHNQILSAEYLADTDTPVSVYLKLTHEQKLQWSFLLESVEGGEIRGRYSFIGIDPDLIWKCEGNISYINRSPDLSYDNFSKETTTPYDSLNALREQSLFSTAENLPSQVATLVGYIGYDMIRLFEHLPSNKTNPHNMPDSLIMRPSIIVIVDSVKNQLSLIAPLYADRLTNDSKLSAEDLYEQASNKLLTSLHRIEMGLPLIQNHVSEEVVEKFIENGSSNLTKQEYMSMVDKARDYIIEGDIFQVVLSQRKDYNFPLPAFDLYRSLRRINPSPFLFHLQLGECAVVGSSPEILVRIRDNKVTIRPIAGTRKRGKNKSEDFRLAQDLLSDPKELAEHLMLLDLGRNDVGRVAKPASVRVTETMSVEYYSHVIHLTSNVEGDVGDEVNPVLALMSGFPAGTVTGAPKVRAMEIIDKLELDKRGIYGGCIGYFGADGSMDTCIALRTAIVKDGIVSIQAGAGIVNDSIPENEHNECINKANAIIYSAIDALNIAKSSNKSNHIRRK